MEQLDGDLLCRVVEIEPKKLKLCWDGKYRLVDHDDNITNEEAYDLYLNPDGTVSAIPNRESDNG